jgi:hypothetical protein
MADTTRTGTILDRIVAGKREELAQRNVGTDLQVCPAQ